jgi:hypothetical protein
MDIRKNKFHRKPEFDYREELQKIDADFGYLKYKLADCFVIPLPDPTLPSNSSKTKLYQSNWKKMYRQARTEGENWKSKWKESQRQRKEIMKQLKDSTKIKDVQTLFGFGPATMKPNVTKPFQDRILRFIWMSKTYFERLTKVKSKTGEGHPCWKLISELLELIYPVRLSAETLASWWEKRKKDFEIWDADTFLESDLAFYQRHKVGLDIQCREWLKECEEWLIEIEKSEKRFQKETKKYREFSE